MSHDDFGYQIQNLEDEVRHVKHRLESDIADERRDREDGERSLHVRIDDAEKATDGAGYRVTALEARLDNLEEIVERGADARRATAAIVENLQARVGLLGARYEELHGRAGLLGARCDANTDRTDGLEENVRLLGGAVDRLRLDLKEVTQ